MSEERNHEREKRGAIQSEFVYAGESFAIEVQGFHRRFGVSPVDLEDYPMERVMLVMEEVGEAVQAANQGKRREFLEELADVVFVSLSILEMCGPDGIDALHEVRLKNARKTTETHAMNPATRKISRIDSL